IEADLPHSPERFEPDRAGIRLDCPLCCRIQAECLPELIIDATELQDRQLRRRTSPEEDGPRRAAFPGALLDLPAECLHVSLPRLFSGRTGVEVAVEALSDAERDVNVEGEREVTSDE